MNNYCNKLNNQQIKIEKSDWCEEPQNPGQTSTAEAPKSRFKPLGCRCMSCDMVAVGADSDHVSLPTR